MDSAEEGRRESELTAPRLIGHRGAPRERPENTLPSFLRALELGADGIELDVHATSDGAVVVHHDPVPRGEPGDDRLRGRPIAELTMRELESFRIADGARIPTLRTVLETLSGRADVFVELKGLNIERAVLDVIRDSPMPDRCAVHAFDHRAVKRVRALAPSLRTGILLSSYLVDPVAALRAAGAADLWQQWELIDAELVEAVHHAGGRVIAWTVNDPSAARTLATHGVDEICSDVLPVIGAAWSSTS